MKFNIDAFKRFNKYVNTPEKVHFCASARITCCLQSRSFPWFEPYLNLQDSAPLKVTFLLSAVPDLSDTDQQLSGGL